MTVGGRILDVRTPSTDELHQWREEFDAAARRPLKTRLRYAFVHTYKPVLDDARYRSFDTMAEYRAWCERELPPWLGYGKDARSLQIKRNRIRSQRGEVSWIA